MFIHKIPFLVQLTECEDPLLQQKAELIFRDNVPQWKVDLHVDDGDGDDDDDDVDDCDGYDDEGDNGEGKGIDELCVGSDGSSVQ